MEPTNAMSDAAMPWPDLPEHMRLEVCPRCDYPFQGLPSAHCCPECGFEYDEQSFLLTGMARGTSNMRPARTLLWVLVGLIAGLAPQIVGHAVFAGTIGYLAIPLAFLWVALFVWLLVTSKRERRGLDSFVFAPGGFGYCSNITPAGLTDILMTPWSSVDAVVVDRKGAHWHRIRIGSAGARSHLRRVSFDAGIRCDELTARWVRDAITARIAASRQGSTD